MKYIVMILLGLFALVAMTLSVSAGTEIEWDFFEDGEDYSFTEWRSNAELSWTIANCDNSSMDIWIKDTNEYTLNYGDWFWEYQDYEIEDGSYTIEFDPNQLPMPFDHVNYTLMWSFDDNYDDNGVIDGHMNFTFGVDDWFDYDTHIALDGALPDFMSFFNMEYVQENGFYWDGFADQPVTIRIIVCNNESEIITSFSYVADRYMNGNSIDWKSQHISSANWFNARKGFFVFVGYETGAFDYGITFDDSMMGDDSDLHGLQNFSYDDLNLFTSVVWDHTDATDLRGLWTYFETFPASMGGEQGTGWTPPDEETTDIREMINEYGDTVDMPWISMAFAIIIIGLCTCIPLGFSLRFGINLPSFLYLLASSAGALISNAVGFFDIWMLLFFFAVMSFITFLMYKEPITSMALALSSQEAGAYAKHDVKALFRKGKEITAKRRMDRTASKSPSVDFAGVSDRAKKGLGSGFLRKKEPKPRRMPTPAIYWTKGKKDVKYSQKGTGSGYSKKSGYATSSDAHLDWLRRHK